MGNHSVNCNHSLLVSRAAQYIENIVSLSYVVVQYTYCICTVYSMFHPFKALCDNTFGKLDGALLPQMVTTHGDASG